MGSLYVSRTARYGHDLRVEVIGDEGAVQIGRFRQTPVRLLDRQGVHHDMPRTTPDRLGDAFVAELQAFVDCLVHGHRAAGHRRRQPGDRGGGPGCHAVDARGTAGGGLAMAAMESGVVRQGARQDLSSYIKER